MHFGNNFFSLMMGVAEILLRASVCWIAVLIDLPLMLESANSSEGVMKHKRIILIAKQRVI